MLIKLCAARRLSLLVSCRRDIIKKQRERGPGFGAGKGKASIGKVRRGGFVGRAAVRCIDRRERWRRWTICAYSCGCWRGGWWRCTWNPRIPCCSWSRRYARRKAFIPTHSDSSSAASSWRITPPCVTPRLAPATRSTWSSGYEAARRRANCTVVVTRSSSIISRNNRGEIIPRFNVVRFGSVRAFISRRAYNFSATG